MEIYLATENHKKRDELEAQIASHQKLNGKIVVKTLDNLPAAVSGRFAPLEDADTFQGNAQIKAKALYSLINTPVLADDSGLEVKALGGRPGVLSARYAPTDPEKINKLLGELSEETDRAARFVTSLCFIDEDGREVFFRGHVDGVIAHEPSGANGFGYDPVFYHPPSGKSFAEMSQKDKKKVSHRGRAVSLFLEFLENWYFR